MGRSFLILLLFSACAGLPAKENPSARTVAAAYADHVHESYRAAHSAALDLKKHIAALAAAPSKESLEACRKAYIAARLPYLETEVFRFYSGPIDDEDGPEGLLNAWPIDEAYIDAVEGKPDSGIVNASGAHPTISPKLLLDLNEKEGEANVSTGYHAIEFLLWGQDHYSDSPGRRAVSDFTTAKNADRRRAYLVAATDLIVEHLEGLVTEWAPDNPKNYRTAFLAADPQASLKKILTGMSMLTGFEMASERLLVAYDTQAQEDEHSCFSDTTHLDVIHNLIGIEEVWSLVRPLAEKADAEGGQKMTESATRCVELARGIPAPFDQAILGKDEAPGRKSILQLIEALEDQADLLVSTSKTLGCDVPISE